jgi:hypothetical protein
MRIKEEERFCSIYIGQRSRETPKRVLVSLYLYHFYTREKREEQHHLLVMFSLVLDFLGQILCLFVDGECIYFFPLFFALELVNTLFFKKKISNKEFDI